MILGNYFARFLGKYFAANLRNPVDDATARLSSVRYFLPKQLTAFKL